MLALLQCVSIIKNMTDIAPAGRYFIRLALLAARDQCQLMSPNGQGTKHVLAAQFYLSISLLLASRE